MRIILVPDMENSNGGLQLLSIGDASIDTFVTPTDSDIQCKLDTKECFVCFSYGDKIPVKNLDFSVGGNAANNAVGVKRLGLNTAIVLTLGDDNIGKQIVGSLENEGVDQTYVIEQPETKSNYSIVLSYGGERTIFTYHAPRSYQFPVALPKVPWVYLTSMGESFRPFYNHIADWLSKNPDIKLGFNPGSWQFRAGVAEITNILKLTYVLFVNRQEAEKIVGWHEGSSGREKELLAGVAKLGPKLVVVTDGENGAYLFDGTKYLQVGVLPVDAYERTGAGDAFGSGFLGAMIHGKTLEEALLWGTINSSSVIGFTGPQKGLVRLTEMPTWLERCKSSGVEVKVID